MTNGDYRSLLQQPHQPSLDLRPSKWHSIQHSGAYLSKSTKYQTRGFWALNWRKLGFSGEKQASQLRERYFFLSKNNCLLGEKSTIDVSLTTNATTTTKNIFQHAGVPPSPPSYPLRTLREGQTPATVRDDSHSILTYLEPASSNILLILWNIGSILNARSVSLSTESTRNARAEQDRRI